MSHPSARLDSLYASRPNGFHRCSDCGERFVAADMDFSDATWPVCRECASNCRACGKPVEVPEEGTPGLHQRCH